MATQYSCDIECVIEYCKLPRLLTVDFIFLMKFRSILKISMSLKIPIFFSVFLGSYDVIYDVTVACPLPNHHPKVFTHHVLWTSMQSQTTICCMRMQQVLSPLDHKDFKSKTKDSLLFLIYWYSNNYKTEKYNKFILTFLFC